MTLKVSVYRYNPEKDSTPSMQDFDIDIPEGKDLMVLDVLALIKEQDDSWSTGVPVVKVFVAPTA